MIRATDIHRHFWVYNAPQYDWMGPGMDVLQRDFLPANLTPSRERAWVDGTIAVQARRLEVETSWLCSLADADASILGVVG